MTLLRAIAAGLAVALVLRHLDQAEAEAEPEPEAEAEADTDAPQTWYA
jgi:hypothetical protein